MTRGVLRVPRSGRGSDREEGSEDRRGLLPVVVGHERSCSLRREPRYCLYGLRPPRAEEDSMGSRFSTVAATVLAALVCVAPPGSVRACLWDRDTLEMERRQFPGVLELLTGKFLRHSEEFYRWRVDDRRRRLEAGEYTPENFDDLAVALEKLGQRQAAIRVMREKDRRLPGLYETHANLGTLLVHDGQLERGLEHIRRAIEIDPAAHFGRERYQLFLVEYVLARRMDGSIRFPLMARSPPDEPLSRELELQLALDRQPAPFGFVAFLEGRLGLEEPGLFHGSEREKALAGVLGMMKFGNHRSPVLLEVLGELLTLGWSDSNRLGARAFLRASLEVEDADAREAYRALAARSMRYHEEMSLEKLEERLAAEIAEADSWFSRIVEDERRWIREGRNPEVEFAGKYYREPTVSGDSVSRLGAWLTFGGRLDLVEVVALWAMVAALTFLVSRRLRRHGSAQA